MLPIGRILSTSVPVVPRFKSTTNVTTTTATIHRQQQHGLPLRTRTTRRTLTHALGLSNRNADHCRQYYAIKSRNFHPRIIERCTNPQASPKSFSTIITSTSSVDESASVATPPILRDDVPERDVMMYDVCIVGGGPAGLAAAIRIKQLNAMYPQQKQMSVCIIDKGRYVLLFAHIITEPKNRIHDGFVRKK
jgi:hypothetical protein